LEIEAHRVEPRQEGNANLGPPEDQPNPFPRPAGGRDMKEEDFGGPRKYSDVFVCYILLEVVVRGKQGGRRDDARFGNPVNGFRQFVIGICSPELRLVRTSPAG
jgi:hypothetical protein